MAEENEALEEGGEGVVAPAKDKPEAVVVEEGDEPQLDPVESIASELGWMPEDKFKGKKEDWKPAADYIREGKTIQTGMARDLKDVRKQMDTMARTSAAILAERLQAEREKLETAYSQAVEDGDAERARKLGDKIHENEGRTKEIQQPNTPPSESVEWVERNPWFNSHPLARAVALETADRYSRAGKTNAEQLAAAEEEVRRAYPHLFANGQQRQAPGVSQPGSRSASPGNRAKGFGDMPKEAQDIAKDMVFRGVITDTDAYVRNYWASEGKTQ